MTTEYEVSLDREACDGIFACLVRDDRFREAEDGLATVGNGDETAGTNTLTATFDDGRVGDARDAAAACPVGAIEVREVGGGE